MPIRSAGIIVLVGGLLSGCDPSAADSGGGTTAEQPTANKETVDKQDRKEAEPAVVTEFVYKLPKEQRAARDAGLDVVVKADHVKDLEGFFLEFFALKPEKSCRVRQNSRESP